MAQYSRKMRSRSRFYKREWLYDAMWQEAKATVKAKRQQQGLGVYRKEVSND